MIKISTSTCILFLYFTDMLYDLCSSQSATSFQTETGKCLEKNRLANPVYHNSKFNIRT